MLSGQCHECGSEYKDLRKHWSLSSSCEEDPDQSTKVSVDCQNCGEEHKEWRYRVEKNGGSYCSQECRDESYREGENVSCSWCGEELYRPPAQLNSMGDYSIDHHFCDKTCEQQFKKENWVLEDHPRWRGGKDGVDAIRDHLSDCRWSKVADSVRQRDGHVCQMCGEFGVTRALDVHHIIPVVSGGTNGEWNLITLCISCHRKAEKYTRNFTEPHLLKPAN